MNAQTLLDDLRRKGVSLETDGERLMVEAPVTAITEKVRAALGEHKPHLLKLLAWEQRKREEADRRGLIIRWSKEPVWISLHDPLSGDWHDFPAADCFPSIVAEANRHRRKGGAA